VRASESSGLVHAPAFRSALPMENLFIFLLFLRMSCYIKYFGTVNRTTHKMHNFISEFDNTKFYFILMFVKIKLIFLNANFMGSI
jgi:hypothetical protein